MTFTTCLLSTCLIRLTGCALDQKDPGTHEDHWELNTKLEFLDQDAEISKYPILHILLMSETAKYIIST
jgi:hypothetical protein